MAVFWDDNPAHIIQQLAQWHLMFVIKYASFSFRSSSSEALGQRR